MYDEFDAAVAELIKGSVGDNELRGYYSITVVHRFGNKETKIEVKNYKE